MNFDELYENVLGTSKGTYVARKLDSVSRQLVSILQEELGLGQNKVAEEDLHVTLVYSHDESRFPFQPDQKSIKSEINETASLEWFGKNNDCLVLKFSCPKMKARHLEICSYYGVKHTYDPYQSHVTLAYDVKNPESVDLTKGHLPAYLRFVAEYGEELEIGWRGTK